MTPPESQYFRAGVGAMIQDGRGRVLGFERAGIPGAWQMPQGGLDAGEEPEDAVWRELDEETGLTADSLALVAPCPDLLAYELPPEARSAKTGRGQTQRWFLFRWTGAADGPAALGEEFSAWRWMSPEDLISQTAAFRRPLYRRLFDWAAGQQG